MQAQPRADATWSSHIYNLPGVHKYTHINHTCFVWFRSESGAVPDSKSRQEQSQEPIGRFLICKPGPSVPVWIRSAYIFAGDNQIKAQFAPW